MKYWLLLLTLALALPVAPVRADTAPAEHPEARPFVESANAGHDIAVAMAAAGADGDKNIIVIMGANWCHDSRALAGWFATPRFATMLNERYKVVYVDAGTPQTGKGRNLDIAARFGIKNVKGTPLVMLVSANGALLNSRKNAASWRNAASRSEDSIYRYFSDFKPAQK